MPELAEVEYFRRQWNAGLGGRVREVALHSRKRVFRGTNTRELIRCLTGARLLGSIARGKRMLFRFSSANATPAQSWLGIHLGMTGRLQCAAVEFRPGKHDHLVLYQRDRALVFQDARQFGRIQFDHGETPPLWWDEATPEVSRMTRGFFDTFLARHARPPIKAVLLMQSGFSGIGNWMADEILWRAKVAPHKQTGELTSSERARTFRATRFVARESLRIIGADDSDLPRTWLIHERWSARGKCPKHGMVLRRTTIGGRTTAWCATCQSSRAKPRDPVEVA
ncbi:MAG: Fpg/Nei family DNA glycosylase [Verrucomicrobia bacterium]|nr:Fpg/Nei family DNA glycosylase [Verrucomicrobiota bacterium]